MNETERTEDRGRNRKKRKRRLRRWILLGIVLVLAGGIGFLVVRKVQRDNTVTYDAYTTSIGTISNSMSYSGSLQLVHEATYTAPDTVKIREVYVKAGDRVNTGDRLMRLSNGSTLTAEFDGTVNRVDAEKGDEVEKGSTLVQVADFGLMQVSFRIGESDISRVSAGQSVRVTVASAGAVFNTEIQGIDYVAYSGNNVAYYTATARVDTSAAAGIYPGMQATVTVPREEVRDAVILKMDAISTDADNSAFVYILEEDGTMAKRPITVGVSNGNYAEVKDGLAEGETVYAVVRKEEENTGLFAGLFGTQQINPPGGGNRTNNNWNNRDGGGNSRPSNR